MSGDALIVIGAGIVGAACAERASAEGFAVTLVESGTVGGGATAAAMGHLVAMDDDPAELALSHYSLDLWNALADLPQAQFSRCGTLWVAAEERELAGIPAKLDRLVAAGIQAEAVDATALYQLEPMLAPGLAGGMLVPHEAVVYGPAVAMHLADCAQSRGARLLRGRARRLTRGGVELEDGQILRGTVLVATGCALPELLPDLPMRARKGHLAITQRHPGLLHHQTLELGYADSAHGSDASSVAFNVQPRPTGQILIGSSREFDDTMDPAVSMPMLRRMLERSFRYMPALRGLDALRVWTGFRPTSIDGRPYIGRVPGMDDVWVAAGHEGLGITTALGTAQLLADQWMQRPSAIDSTPFDPARLAATAAA
ncbi:MAG: FAD-dependent oxidoreductase [Rhodanobacter sp.]